MFFNGLLDRRLVFCPIGFHMERSAHGFDPVEFGKPATAEARATADMYRRACDLYVLVPRMESEEAEAAEPLWAEPGKLSPKAETAWFKENDEALRLTLKASERTACDFFDPTGGTSLGTARASFDSLGFLLILFPQCERRVV